MSATKAKVKPSERRKARRYAVQALYQWQLSDNKPKQIEVDFIAENDFKKADTVYFSELLNAVPEKITELDELLQPHVDRKLAEVDPVERAVLRIAAYEMQYRIDVPYRVIINEAIELTKIFGATDGHKFVNGIMDKLAIKVRSLEIKHQRSSKRA